MAARKRKITLTDDWKAKIRASSILNRLDACVMGDVEMSAVQVNAARIILSKLVPDLARTEMTGKDGGDIEHSIRVKFG